MVGDKIKISFEKLPPSIILMAKEYKEARDVIIRFLSRSADISEISVIHWLKVNNIEVKGLDDYRIKNTRL